MTIIENAKDLKKSADSLIRRSGGRPLTRLIVFVCLVSVLPVIYLTYTAYLQGVVVEQGKRSARQLNISTDIYLLKEAIAQLQLCVTSKKAEALLANWYCEQAIAAYESISEYWPAARREAVLSKKAVEGMILNSEYYLMLKSESLVDASENRTKESLLLEVMLTSKAMFALLVLALSIGGYVYYGFYRGLVTPMDRHHSRETENRP
ncbi:hypothetical protein [Saccharospirillum sp.]|uniref:hypothetical protein n=1 Tax=Saccharospirillum sp. TaxID=2033801 RepID=UPI0034A0573F